MSWWNAVAAGASIGGDLFGASKQHSYNKQLLRMQQRFTERMSNTAFQRATADLDKAGLNRILALGSPATTPTGGSAGPSASLGNLGSSAVQRARIGAEIKLLERQADERWYQARLNENQAAESASRTELNNQNFRIAQIQEKLSQATLTQVERDALLAELDQKLYEKYPALRYADRILGTAGSAVGIYRGAKPAVHETRRVK